MDDPPIQDHTYVGRTESEAGAQLAQDAATMAAAGYRPSSQSWAEAGGYSTAARVCFAIAAACTVGGWLAFWQLSLVAMIFLVVGLTRRRHDGELTVTWTRAGPNGPEAKPGLKRAASQGAPDPGDQL
jgi:hypothetical protein